MKTFIKFYTMLTSYTKNERGSQSLEWIGIAAVVVILVGTISSVFAEDESFASAILGKLVDFVSNIGG
ncbi:hypothetical protein [Halalkalibacter urbisdiaboli]|uniref:hypothetical protein n=1 Tax=Halalkalibacter urbisdiaboli TaxID=1960589 RepID=UPI000B452723|nr:hypothetical protein [Halalkalibacter urbisdiaboli]